MDVGRFVAAASQLPWFTPSAGPAWSLGHTAGRLVELSGQGASARLTAAFALVLEAQRQKDPTAWVTLRDSAFFPPDAAAGGVDLASLAVVRVKTAREAARAADPLVRSGGFGLVVLDLDGDRRASAIPPPLLTRLLGLAQKYDTVVLALTEKPAGAPSLSSLVSLRAEARREPRGELWDIRVNVLKDKRRGPGETHVETCHGPAGLR